MHLRLFMILLSSVVIYTTECLFHEKIGNKIAAHMRNIVELTTWEVSMCHTFEQK